MKKFRFTLDSLLKVKELRERLAEGQVFSACRAVSACQERLAEFQKSLEDLSRQMDQSLSVGVPLDGWPAAFEQTSRLEVALRSTEEELAKAEAALQLARSARTRLAKEVETLKTLRREQIQMHRQECRQEEQELLDEIGLRQWSRGPRDEDAQ